MITSRYVKLPSAEAATAALLVRKKGDVVRALRHIGAPEGGDAPR